LNWELFSPAPDWDSFSPVFSICPRSIFLATSTGNKIIDALTDGQIMFRAMMGLTGDAVTNGVLGVGATRKTWPEIRAYMNTTCGTSFL